MRQVQKVVPGTLEALAEVISEQATLTYYPHGVNPSSSDVFTTYGSKGGYQKVSELGSMNITFVQLNVKNDLFVSRYRSWMQVI